MRVSPGRFIGWFGIVVVAMAIVVTRSVRATGQLRDEAARVEVQFRDLTTLREERARLIAQQPSPDARENLAREQATLAKARAALQEQRTEFQRAALATMQRTKAEAQPAREPPSRVSPQATIHSTIAAVNHGEAEDLAELIDFDPAARAEAENFFASLPPDLRAQFGSPAQLVAHVMAAKTSTFLGASGESPVFLGPDDATMRMTLQFPWNITRTATLQFHRDDAGWKLRVPATVIEGYRARVTGVVFADVPTAPAP